MKILSVLLFVYFLFLMIGKFWDRVIFARVGSSGAGVAPLGVRRVHSRGGSSLSIGHISTKGF